MAVMVFVVMGISSLRSDQWLLDGCRWAGPRAQLWLKQANTEAHQAEDGINRYRRGKDAGAKAGWLDSAADIPGSPASTRPISHDKDSDWSFFAASPACNITYQL
jgi:hypothetical protein